MLDIFLLGLFSFPVNFLLVIPMVFGFKYTSIRNIYMPIILINLGIIGFHSNNKDIFFSFWNMNGTSSILIFSYMFLWFHKKTFSSINIHEEEIESTKNIREKLINIEDIQQRKNEYIKYAVLSAKQLQSNITTIKYTNTLFWLGSLSSILIIQFFVEHLKTYLYSGDFLFFSYITTKIKTIIPTFPQESLELMFKYYPTMWFIFGFTLLVVLTNIIKLLLFYKKETTSTSYFATDLYLFKLPDYSIFIFLISLIYVTLTFYFHFKLQSLDYIFFNAFLICSFVYFLNGLAICLIFCKVRLMPVKTISLVILLLSLFLIELLLLLMVFIIILGIIDFVFELRKKALHSIPMRHF